MHEAAFVLGRHWVEHFHRRAARRASPGTCASGPARAGSTSRSRAASTRSWPSSSWPTFAEQTDRTWILHGAIMTPQPEPGRDHRRPGAADERLPGRRGLGARRGTGPCTVRLHAPDLRPGPAGRDVRPGPARQARQHREAAHGLVDLLEQHADRLGLDPRATSGRLHTARAAADLLDGWTSRHSDMEIVRAARPGRSRRPGRTGRSRASAVPARSSGPALRPRAGTPSRSSPGSASRSGREADEILATLRRAGRDDELTTALAPGLQRARSRATDLLRRRHPASNPDPRCRPSEAAPAPPPGPSGVRYSDRRPDRAWRVRCDGATWTTLAELRTVAARPGRRIEVIWRVVP